MRLLESGIPWGTWFQNVDLDRLLEWRPRYVVLDPYSGPGGGPWTRDRLERLVSAGITPVAYVSTLVVGDWTEVYEIARDAGLLGPKDPEWPGDYAVRYWDERYVRLLAEYASKLLANGWRGICLDVVDGFTRGWFISWLREQGIGFTDAKRHALRLVDRVLTRVGGCIKAVIVGSTVDQEEFHQLYRRHGVIALVEDVISTPEGLRPDDVRRYIEAAVAHMPEAVVIEYQPPDRIPEGLVEEVLSIPGVIEVYFGDYDHARPRPAAVPG